MKCFKISVIVPVYNVQDYIRKCINSLLKQNCQNYEIILVDDGSTDNSGKICDEYEKKYSNIKVFHKINGGLSDARNYGVKRANGEYITFIDSDDYVSSDYLLTLIDAIKKENADIAVSDFLPIHTIIDIPDVIKKSIDIENFTGYEILELALLGKKGGLSAWGKLYKKEIFDKYQFPKGKLYEDMYVLFRIYMSVESVVYINQSNYFYLQRENSIVHSRLTEEHLYGVKSCIDMLKNIDSDNQELIKCIKCRIMMQACGHIPAIVQYSDKLMYRKIRELITPYIKDVLLWKKASVKLKIRSITYLLGERLGIGYAYVFLNGKALYRKLLHK